MFSGRELNVLEAQCMSFKEIDDPPGLNASELAKSTYKKLHNKSTPELEKLFNSTISKAKIKKKDDDKINISLFLKTPSEIIHLQDVDKFQNLSKNELIESEFKNIRIDKKEYFKEKGKYSLVVIWKDGYGYEVQKKSVPFMLKKVKK